eukprot:3580587-Amphidinium_carterae.1
MLLPMQRPLSEGAQARYSVHWEDIANAEQKPSTAPHPSEHQRAIHVTVTPQPPRKMSTDGGGRLPPAMKSPRRVDNDPLVRLSTPKVPGASDGTKRRAAAKQQEQTARRQAAAAVGEVRSASVQDKTGLSFGDPWRTSTQDGYASALIHAAV